MKFPLALLSCCCCQQTSAAFVIVQNLDAFDSGPVPLVKTSGTHQQVYQDPNGAILGEWRAIELAVTSNLFGRDAVIGISGTTGEFIAELGPLVSAEIALIYHANQAGLGGVDLTAGGATAIGLVVNDSDENLSVTVTITDSNGEAASYQINQAAAVVAPTLLDFSFASFTNASATDFSRVESLRLDFQNGVAGDFAVTMLGTYAVIPEPEALLLALFSGGGLFFRRRR